MLKNGLKGECLMKIFHSDKRKIPRLKRAFIKIYKEFGLKSKTIAKMTGVPISTVYRYLNK